MWWFGLLLIGVLGAIFYLSLGRVTRLSVTDQLLERQQVLARAQATNIASFFQIFGDSLVILARSPSAERRDASTVRLMDAFMEQWRESGFIGGVVLTDTNGIIRFHSSVTGVRDIGVNVSDRDYFAWAKSQEGEGEYFVSRAVESRLGGTKGQAIVLVASPVYSNGVFTGVFSASVKLEPLTRRFLEFMKVSDKSEVYLIGSQGDVLYNSSVPNSFTSNKSEIPLGEGELRSIVNSDKEGKLQIKERLIAHSPVPLGNRNWQLITTSPTQEVMNLTRPVYIRLAIVLLLVFGAMLIFGVMTSQEIQAKSKQPVSKTD